MATSAGRRPSLRRSSISRRCSRASEPWCARTSSSPASSLRRSASRSASRRLLTKTIVERWPGSARAGADGSRPDRVALARAPRPSHPTAARDGSGSPARPCPRPAHDLQLERLRTRRRRSSPDAAAVRLARRPGSGRPRSGGAAWPTARCAAAAARASAASRSSDSARCAPRLVPARAWISSTMTRSTPTQRPRAPAEVSIR